MLVGAVLQTKPKQIVSTVPSASIDEAMEMLITNGIGCLLVVDNEDKLIGILSDKDIFARIHETKGDYHSLKVEDLMTTDVIVGVPSDTIEHVAGVMEKNTIRHIPIVKNERAVGMISLRDVVKAQLARQELENRYMSDMLEKRDKSGDM